MKRVLHRVVLRLERILALFLGEQSQNRVIEPYAGYATPQNMIVRGRVLTSLRRQNPAVEASWLTNLRSMVSLFLTDEVAGVRVRSGDVTATSDEEGYFTLHLPLSPEPGWINVPVHVEGFEDAAQCPVLVPSGDAEFMVISDVDDTVMETGAYSLPRNLWTSMMGNILQRHVHPDAIRLLSDLSCDGRNPVYYVSSSPWNLYTFLTRIFERNGLVRGPMFLRDLGVSGTKFITDDHGDHKGRSIDTLIEANPNLPVVLIGDTGQKDTAIYADTVSRHRGRVRAVILRETEDRSDSTDLAYMDQITRRGVAVFHKGEFPDSKPVIAAALKATKPE